MRDVTTAGRAMEQDMTGITTLDAVRIDAAHAAGRTSVVRGLRLLLAFVGRFVEPQVGDALETVRAGIS